MNEKAFGVVLAIVFPLFGQGDGFFDNLESGTQLLSTSIAIKNTMSHKNERQLAEYDDPQIEIVKQQIWENLRKVPGTERDYVSSVKLSIASGNVIDAECKLSFPKSSWEIASVLLDDYKDVLKKTNVGIFEVIYKLITDSKTLATDILINGLWRPWLGSHVHIEGRGMDIGSIRGSGGDGVIFEFNTSPNENSYGKKVREVLTTNFPRINQYLSPWYMCSPATSCTTNNGASALERIHRDHLHITLNP